MQALLLVPKITLRFGIYGYDSLLTVPIDWKDSKSAKLHFRKS